MIKVRGVYKTTEECEKKIEKLKNLDPYFNMYICEVSKWGGLFPEEEVRKMDNVDFQYRESILNTMAAEYQQNKDKADAEFNRRTAIMKKRAELEGTKEGQELLASKRENPKSIQYRIESAEKQMKELEERIKEMADILTLSREQLASYTEEELLEFEKENTTGEHAGLFADGDIFLNKKTE